MVSGVKQGYALSNLTACKFGPPVDKSRSGKQTVMPGVAALSDVNTVIELSVTGKASDPLVNISAPIKYDGRFVVCITGTVASTARKVSVYFDGYISEFPAFEAYATYNGNTKALFKLLPPPGNTVMNLAGNFFRGPQRRVLSQPVYF